MDHSICRVRSPIAVVLDRPIAFDVSTSDGDAAKHASGAARDHSDHAHVRPDHHQPVQPVPVRSDTVELEPPVPNQPISEQSGANHVPTESTRKSR